MHVGNAQSTHDEPSSVNDDIITMSGMASGQPRCHAASSTPPFFLDLHFGLVRSRNARTIAGSAAAPAHDPMGPRDARRRQEITYSRSTGPLCAELELGRPLVPL